MAVSAIDERAEEARAFNRFYTKVIGVLGEGLLRTPYSLTEARVIFELAQRDETELLALRRGLDLDAGYLTRIVSRLDAAGIVHRKRSQTDRRRQVIGLTARGRRAFDTLNERSAQENRALIAQLEDDEQRRLIGAMRAIRQILDGAPSRPPFRLRPPTAGDFGWVVQRHGSLYAEEYGWDERFEALVARIVADYLGRRDPEREAAWIAELDGERAGCVLCVKKSMRIAQLRLLLVEPRARGMGIGAALVERCIEFARDTGYRKLTLWTNDVLDDARRIYERAGFELVAEDPHRSFGRDLVGQHWERTL